MKINYKQKNKRGFTPTPSFYKEKVNLVSGFTLVETMFAVMILTFTIVSMMTVVSSSMFTARYSRDEITANYLLQEVVDFVRNDRDTSVFLQNIQTTDAAWNSFKSKYNACLNPNRGCYFDVPYTGNASPALCSLSGVCPVMCFDKDSNATSFYRNADISSGLCPNSDMTKTSFQRRIIIKSNDLNPDDILDVEVIISWNNGVTQSRSLKTTLTKWQP